MPDLHSSSEQNAARPRWLIVSDLDGSLLDHYDYSHTAVDELLPRLQTLNIPLVFNSSKTTAEIEQWRKVLTNRDPFIVENGSAIFIPVNYFPAAPHRSQHRGEYHVIEMGTVRDELLLWLDDFQKRHGSRLTHFARADLEQIMQLTGLKEADARLAMDRHYSEPIFWQGDEHLKATLINEAEASGYKILQGGRFLHLLGDCDKGDASLRLAEEFKLQTGMSSRPKIMALGDSGNDVAMLEMADVAGIIRSPVHKPPRVNNKRQQLSQAFGPEGWRELVQAYILAKN